MIIRVLSYGMMGLTPNADAKSDAPAEPSSSEVVGPILSMVGFATAEILYRQAANEKQLELSVLLAGTCDPAFLDENGKLE